MASLRFKFSINHVIEYFIFADLALLAGWGLVTPIFGIFVSSQIAGGTITTVGVAAAIYWFTRAVLQIPIAAWLDAQEGERAEFRCLFVGLIVAAIAAFFMPLATTITHIYIVEFIHAVAFALYIPAWSSIFSRHLDRDHTTLDWALDRSAASFAAGISALLGGAVAAAFGFGSVFVLAGVASLIAAVFIFFAPRFVVSGRVSKRVAMVDPHQ